MLCDMIDNECLIVIYFGEVVEEKVLFLDCFGLWLGFYFCLQDEYLVMVQGYCSVYGVDIVVDDLCVQVIEWQVMWGVWFGWVVWQFFIDFVGCYGVLVQGFY